MAEMAQLRHELIALKGKADRLPAEDGCYCAVIEHAGPGRAGSNDVAKHRASPARHKARSSSTR